MISIIVCSRTKFLCEELSRNINDTIGAAYELIVVDNSESTYSIFEAYNLGIHKSKGNILCFIHDDILFHTNNWGKILQLQFEENFSFDLIGVAGSKVRTQFPVGWWDCEHKYKVINLIQHDNGNVNKYTIGLNDCNLEEVLSIDGVFMAFKNSFDFLFDENLNGFHNYDINLSSEVIAKGKKIGVTGNILIEHFSSGTLNKDWLISRILYHKKNHSFLKNNISTFEQELFAGKKFIDHIINIFGKKRSSFYIFSIFQLSSSIKVNLELVRYIFKRIL